MPPIAEDATIVRDGALGERYLCGDGIVLRARPLLSKLAVRCGIWGTST